MPRNRSGEPPLLPVNDHDADNIAAFIMARAFAELYRDADHRPLPKTLAAILRQMKRPGDQA
jgi:hypothetical protein